MQLGHVGIWWSGNWPGDDGELADTVGQLHASGYETLWASGGFDRGLNPLFQRLLASNRRVKVASGIHSIWTTAAEETAAAVGGIAANYGPRFVLGLGVSHAPLVEQAGHQYEHPYRHMVDFLDGLDRAGVSKDERILAALGPRMLALAAERSAGAHPYFVPVEHTYEARRLLGPEPVLAPEVAVLLETEADSARAMIRSYTEFYLGLPNYAQNLRRLGYDEDDLEHGGSDRLVDAVVAWGDEAAIAARVREHLDAGASHVCLQVLNGGNQRFPLAEYQLVASSLFPL